MNIVYYYSIMAMGEQILGVQLVVLLSLQATTMMLHWVNMVRTKKFPLFAFFQLLSNIDIYIISTDYSVGIKVTPNSYF